MTIPVSTVPAALSALTALVQTAAAGDTPPAGQDAIYIVQGDVPAIDLPPDIIEVGTTVRRTVQPAEFIGGYAAQALQEKYTISSLVSATSGSIDPVAIVNRAYALAAYIETAVRTDPTLGGNVLDAYPSGTDGGEPGWTESPVLRICELTVNVDCIVLN